MTERLGIIGFPVGHSISQIFQQAAIDYYHLDISYVSWEVNRRSLRGFINKLRSTSDMVLGCNVTVPHKEAVIRWLDEISPEAMRVGAVNTIINNNGYLRGHNTDIYGFCKSLENHYSFSPVDKSVLVIGSGGAGRSVAFALADLGVRSITLANRTLARAERLAIELKGLVSQVKVMSLISTDIKRVASGMDMIVNCTTLGMSGSCQETMPILQASDIPKHALVYDLVYNPFETPLIKEASKAGAMTLGGLTMLIYQGAAAFELWIGREAPLEIMFKSANKALGLKNS